MIDIPVVRDIVCSCPGEKCVGQHVMGVCVHTCVQCAFSFFFFF